MKENSNHQEETWKKVNSYLDGRSKKFDIDKIIVNKKTSTFIIKKLIKEEDDKSFRREEKLGPLSWKSGGKFDRRRNKRLELVDQLDQLKGKLGLWGGFLLFKNNHIGTIYAVGIILLVAVSCVSIYMPGGSGDGWFCSEVNGEKKCYRQKDIDKMIP